MKLKPGAGEAAAAIRAAAFLSSLLRSSGLNFSKKSLEQIVNSQNQKSYLAQRSVLYFVLYFFVCTSTVFSFVLNFERKSPVIKANFKKS